MLAREAAWGFDPGGGIGLSSSAQHGLATKAQGTGEQLRARSVERSASCECTNHTMRGPSRADVFGRPA